MVYRIDSLEESGRNPITGEEYAQNWMVLMLTHSAEYRLWCGSRNGCAYTVKLSRSGHPDWKTAVGDCLGYCEATGKNVIAVMSKDELEQVRRAYGNRRYDEPFLREGEPKVLIHSTPFACWESIHRDGMLKSRNRLKRENAPLQAKPIGALLGDPEDFSDYIMFGGGVTGEIVVHSHQTGRVEMDENAAYQTGARLYFDAGKMAADGLLIRDGCHIKVRDSLPLSPYLLWTATWDRVGLSGILSTPKRFAELADRQFHLVRHYDALVEENNDPARDPLPLQAYMEKWDGDIFRRRLELGQDRSVLEIGVGTGRLAQKVAPCCKIFCGIDISEKTVARARENLASFPNVRLICGDFLSYDFPEPFHVIYSSLTLFHVREKRAFLQKAASLLVPGGRLVLSLDKSREKWLVCGERKLELYPDSPEEISALLTEAGLTVLYRDETEFAHILTMSQTTFFM